MAAKGGLGMLLHVQVLPLKFLRMPVVIGIEKSDEFPCRHVPAYVARTGGTDISGQRNDPDPVGVMKRF